METERGSTVRTPDVRDIAGLRDRMGIALSFAGTAVLSCYAELLKPLGLRPISTVALAYIAEHDDADQSRIGRILGVNRASAMAICSGLEAAGLITRGRADRGRRNRLEATPLGRERLAESFAIEEALVERLMPGVPAEDRARLKLLLNGIVARANGTADPAAPLSPP